MPQGGGGGNQVGMLGQNAMPAMLPFEALQHFQAQFSPYGGMPFRPAPFMAGPSQGFYFVPYYPFGGMPVQGTWPLSGGAPAAPTE